MPAIADKTISFVQKFDKKPPRAWFNGATITIKLEGENLSTTWKSGGSGGTGTMKPAQK